ncbi:MAG: type VI secretion system-associated protein TagO [Treponema sp.]|jgi:type VI secretion system protein VasI|nr:type VI secretion system-associated protein TagO [Treponema sp.]
MKPVYFLFAFLFVLIGYIYPENSGMEQELREAAAISNSFERIIHYDFILEKYGLKEKSAEPAATTKWAVSINSDPVDDSKIIIFMIYADSGTNRYGDKVRLVIRWKNGKNELYINWNDYMGSNPEVTLRVGQSEAETKEWNISTDNRTTFYPGYSGTAQLELIRKMLDSKTLVTRSTPYSENPITAIFDITGLRNIAEKYNSDLKWF